jgi:hypothetical protein
MNCREEGATLEHPGKMLPHTCQNGRLALPTNCSVTDVAGGGEQPGRLATKAIHVAGYRGANGFRTEGSAKERARRNAFRQHS